MATLVAVRRVLVVALGASLPAQALDESRGPLAGAAVAVAVDAGPVAGDGLTRAHRNGFQGPLATIPPGGSLPNLGAILAAQGAPPNIDYDDISLGRDDVLFDGAGFSDVANDSWGAVTFSLRDNAIGAPGPEGLRIRQEVALGSIGSALFTFVHEGNLLPAEQVGRVERSHSRQELGISVGADVDSIDFPAMLGAEQSALANSDPMFGPLDPYPHSIYFTVSSASLGAVPAVWWGVPATPMSGATIFVITRATQSAPWTSPAVWKTFADLGLTQAEDIDGLAIDRARSRVMFSCTGTFRNQFNVLNGISLVMPVPQIARQADGTPISQATGLGASDDVDAICTLDPTIGSSGGPPPVGDDFGSSCGTPRFGLLGVPSVHASAYRRFEAGQRYFDTWMVGWPPVTAIGPGVAALFATVGNDPTLIPLDLQLRNVTSSVPGNPIHYALNIPPNAALGGLRITFRWVAVDANFTELAEALPVLVYP